MIRAINLKCEYLNNPIGIDVKSPRLMWNVEGAKKQTAYRIVAQTGNITVWDSEKVASSRMQAVFPAELISRQRVEYTVTLWNENDDEGDSVSAYFETGLLRAEDWKAKWISGDYTPKKKVRYPVDCFKKVFTASKAVKARLYITACGLYEATLNGTRVGDFVLAPGITDYRKRVQYQTYDVTELIKQGENELEVQLADGWYRGSVGAWGHTCAYGVQTKLLLQLEIEDEKGQVSKICSDASFAWSNDGEIRFADNKDGERVDARLTPTYSKMAREVTHLVVPTSSNNIPVTENERFSATVIKTPSGKTVLDFGQNIAGYVSFRCTAKNGQKVFLRFGEMLDTNGEFTQDNIQCKNKKITTPLQQIEYICKEGENDYKTKFAIFGFRYVLVETDVPVRAEDFTAIAVYSAMEETLDFNCSNELVNQFVKCTVWSAKSNSCDLPTDCPTRERHGWSGDAQIFVGTATYMFGYAPFIRKYLNDMRDWQEKNGRLPQIAPYGGVDGFMNTMNGSVGWADAGVLIPYHLWKKYGDTEILRAFYPMMKKYAAFMIRRCGKFSIWAKRVTLSKKNRKYLVNCGQSYGEWAEPNDVHPFQISDFMRPHPEESTAYTSFVMRRMAEIARFLGNKEDCALYEQYAEGCKAAYRELVTKEKFSLDTNRQAKLVRPLYMKLLDENCEKQAKDRLIRALDEYGWRLGTGFLSTPFILDVLTEINIEYAYKLLENEECPGWLFMPKNGATTVWEAWEGNATPSRGIASLNHYSKGAVCEWLFSTVCGVRVAGENRFEIEPRKGGSFTHANVRYASMYGTIESGWESKNGKTVYSVEIPCNTTAKFKIGDMEKELTSGTYSFEIDG